MIREKQYVTLGVLQGDQVLARNNAYHKRAEPYHELP